jgi:hypothetical protein
MSSQRRGRCSPGSLTPSSTWPFRWAIAIHHYFIDGALYKLRHPEVTRHLFAHLPAVSRLP